jgi:hypothetical protein
MQPDGIERAPAVEKRINEQLALCFKGESGKAALDYLRSISIERVCGPFAGDAELRHLEGMRHIVAIISQRIAQHHKDQMNAGSSTVPVARPRTRPARRNAPAAPRRL